MQRLFKFIQQKLLANLISNELVKLMSPSVLQIRRGERDNLGIIFHITPSKHIL